MIKRDDVKRPSVARLVKYGITPDEWLDMFESQGFRCAICIIPYSNEVVWTAEAWRRVTGGGERWASWEHSEPDDETIAERLERHGLLGLLGGDLEAV